MPSDCLNGAVLSLSVCCGNTRFEVLHALLLRQNPTGSVYMPTFGCFHHFFTLTALSLFISPSLFGRSPFSFLAFEIPQWLRGKESTLQCRSHRRPRFDPWIGKIHWRRKWQPTPVFCLRNPMDRGAWWAIVHGVTKSWT